MILLCVCVECCVALPQIYFNAFYSIAILENNNSGGGGWLAGNIYGCCICKRYFNISRYGDNKAESNKNVGAASKLFNWFQLTKNIDSEHIMLL